MKFSPTFRLHFIILLWGFTGILGKLISTESAALVWYRVLIGSAAIAVFLYLKKLKFRVSKTQVFQLLGIGFLIGFHWYFFFEAIKQSNVSIALTTLSTCALFTAFLEPLFLKRKLDFSEILVGAVVVVCFAFLFKVETKYTYGIILGLFSSLFSGIFTVLNSKFYNSNTVSSSTIMLYELLGAWILLSFYLVGNQSVGALQISAQDLGWLLVLGALLTAFPMIESVRLMKYISPYTMVLSVNLEPVYGMILAVLIFKDGSEKMSFEFYVIAFVLISSIVINALLKKRKKKKNLIILP